MPFYKNVSKIGLVLPDVGLVEPGDEFESTNEMFAKLRAIELVKKEKPKKVAKKSDTGSDE
jgi:hypothetical protein